VKAKEPTLVFVTAPDPTVNIKKSGASNATEATAEVVTANPDAPAKVDPPVPDATITVPLAEAEHHVIRGNSDVSILGIYNMLSGPLKGLVRVDYYNWSTGNWASVNLNSFGSDDQTYMRNWAKKQAAVAAASHSTTPPLTGATPIAERIAIEEGLAPMPEPQSAPPPAPELPPQPGPTIITAPQN
jgi:hypothetical protein